MLVLRLLSTRHLFFVTDTNCPFVQDNVGLAQHLSVLFRSPPLLLVVILVLVHLQGWHPKTIYLYRLRFARLGLVHGDSAGLGNSDKNNTRCRAAVPGLWRRIVFCPLCFLRSLNSVASVDPGPADVKFLLETFVWNSLPSVCAAGWLRRRGRRTGSREESRLACPNRCPGRDRACRSLVGCVQGLKCTLPPSFTKGLFTILI